MSLIKYRIPCKTFIVGEYNVLYNNNGLLIATAPDFLLTIDGNIDIYNSDSIPISGGCIGCGSSSAKFLAAYFHLKNALDLSDLLSCYKGISSSKTKPSGADIITQALGGITYFDREKSFRLSWPFKEYEILIFKSPTKIKTYEHLDSYIYIEVKDLDIMQNNVAQVLRGLQNNDINAVITGINAYQEQLIKLDLVSDQTLQILKSARLPEILAIKGCGAMCNDVIITLNHRSNSDMIATKLQELDLKYIASTNDIVGGIDVVC